MTTDNKNTLAENTTPKKKRSAEARARKRKRPTTERAPVKNVLEDSRQSSLQPSSGRNSLKALGIDLNPTTARQAVILSEVIGKPLSRRGRQR